MNKNNKSIDSYFEAARNFKTPISEDYARNLVENRNLKYIVNHKHYSKKGLKTMSLISALITITVLFYIGLSTNEKLNLDYSTNELQIQELANLEENTIDNYEAKANQENNNDLKQQTNEETVDKKENTKFYSKHYHIEDLTWDLIKFDEKDWSFERMDYYERTSFANDKGEFYKSIVRHSYAPLEDKDLIKISNHLEDTLSNILNVNKIKFLCNLELPEYFQRLSQLNADISVKNQSDSLIQMINLYAHINRYFLNNPGDLINLKSKGIILPKENLEKLGIIITDSTISFPYDMVIKQFEGVGNILFLFPTELIDKENPPEKDFLIKMNRVFEWETNKPKYDSDGEVNWKKYSVHRRVREEFPLMSAEYFEPHAIGVVSYYRIFGIDEMNNYRNLSPLVFEELFIQSFLNASLYFTNNLSKRIYDINLERNKDFWNTFANQNNIPEAEMYNARRLAQTREIISNNMMTTYKLRYLIPIDIQVPYYGFSKEELDEMKFFQSITLWYYPSPEFFEALPKDIRKQLENEIYIAEAITKGLIQPEEACKKMNNNESLLGLCDLLDKSIMNLSVYPNPANDIINLKFDVVEKCFYKIVLADSYGRFIDDLSSWTEQEIGNVELSIHLQKTPKGAYLVQVITGKGERLLQKIIVN